VKKTIGVIGAGIAGLAAAHRVSAEHDVIVFERAARSGGKIHSQHIDRYLFEWGPAGFLSNADALRALVSEIGLDDALIEAAPAAKNRFIYWGGALHAIPSKPPQLLGMSLLSPAGKLRAIGELFVGRRAARAGGADESVFDFMRRRFGREVAERIVSPVLLGVSGGDAKTTSLAAVFPRLPELEREHGSVIRGMMRGARTGARMCSFSAGGMQRLTDRLAERLGDRLRLSTPVERIERHGAGWRIAFPGGDAQVDGVIVTAPSAAAAALAAGFDAELAAQIRTIAYAPMRAIGVAFRRADVPHPLDGFGFLVARNAGARILGAVFTSTVMPEQAPPETAYLRIFVGGATDPDAGALDAERVRAFVLADLQTTLGITAEPLDYHEVVWPEAIPQYAIGHGDTIRAIEARTATHPRFALAGNAYRGLGVGDNVRDALAIADRIAGSES
jgi:oxygen-dependent protoporphyrinogen oxidase